MPTAKFTLVQQYPTGISRLWEVLGRRDYVQRKYRFLGSEDLSITRLDRSPTMLEVELEREVRLAPAALPIWARGLFAGQRRLRHRTRWVRREASRVECELDIAPVGEQVRARGRGQAVERGPDDTEMKLAFTVECDVLGIGGPIARVFARQLEAAMRKDHAFTVRYLARREKSEGNKR